MLLGLVHEGEGVGAKALESFGISLEAARKKVGETIGPAATSPAGSPPFTPRTKKVLELSLREALQLGHSYIGTEHLLLALVREGEGVGAQVLVQLGADLDRVRWRVLDLLSGYQAEKGQPIPVAGGTGGVRLSPRPRHLGAPACPGCRVDLADSLRWRTHEVAADPAEGPEAPNRRVSIWWCRACGRTVGVTPEPGPPG